MEGADSKSIMIRNSNPLMRWRFRFNDDVASRLMYPGLSPLAAESLCEPLARNVSGQPHATGQHFITDQMEANPLRPSRFEKTRGRRINDVPAQFFPAVTLSKDVFREALCAITAVFFLHRLEYQFSHSFNDTEFAGEA